MLTQTVSLQSLGFKSLCYSLLRHNFFFPQGYREMDSQTDNINIVCTEDNRYVQRVWEALFQFRGQGLPGGGGF